MTRRRFLTALATVPVVLRTIRPTLKAEPPPAAPVRDYPYHGVGQTINVRLPQRYRVSGSVPDWPGAPLDVSLAVQALEERIDAEAVRRALSC